MSQYVVVSKFKTLGLLDAYFGLMPVLGSILGQNTDTKKNFDVKKFLIQMRQYMILEECFSSVNYNKPVHQLTNILKPELLVFTKPIPNNKIGKNNIEKTFGPLIKSGQLISFSYDKSGYAVEKNPKFIKTKPYVPADITNSLNLTSKEKF